LKAWEGGKEEEERENVEEEMRRKYQGRRILKKIHEGEGEFLGRGNELWGRRREMRGGRRQSREEGGKRAAHPCSWLCSFLSPTPTTPPSGFECLGSR
jgi:hypothetical protein